MLRTMSGTWKRWAPLVMTLATTGVAGLTSVGVAQTSQGQETWTYIMDDDPRLLAPERRVFDPRLVPLWRQALRHDEQETRRLAADAVTLGQRRGMTGLAAAIPELRAAFLASPEVSSLRRSLARALVAVDDRQFATQLAQGAERDLEVARIVEPALAVWEREQYLDRWRARLLDVVAPVAARRLAIEGLFAGTAADRESEETLRSLLLDPTVPSELRLAAARALSRLTPADVVVLADQLQGTLVERLAAAALLTGNATPEAQSRLATWSADPNEALAVAALRGLRAADPAAAVVAAERALSHGSAALRRLAVECVAQRADNATIAALGPLLADTQRTVRRAAQEQLATLVAADPGLRPAALRQITAALGGERWQGHEQGSRLAVALDDRASAPRLAELLESHDIRTTLPAAWALSRLGEAEQAGPILRRATGLLPEMRSGQPTSADAAAELTQLCQALGRLRHAPADPLLRQLIPKTPLFPDSRAAAIWALGHLHAGQATEDLAVKLNERMIDIDSLMPEETVVRQACAIALGRMGAKSQLKGVLDMIAVQGPTGTMGQSLQWARQQLSGEPAEPSPVRELHYSDWFLVPANP